jgi:aconitate hydratase
MPCTEHRIAMTNLQASISAGTATYRFTDLPGILGNDLYRLPVVLRLLAENYLRTAAEPDIDALRFALSDWLAGNEPSFELEFRPNRLLMHDTTCTPALADVAGLKAALAEAGGDPGRLNPTLPVEVSVDHSLSVDHFAEKGAVEMNSRNEYVRNGERYSFLKWAAGSMRNLRINPPGTGIMHTINLEQLSTVLVTGDVAGGGKFAHPDMLLGTDSHTPMVNGIGVLGWGVGGLEAESVMFGQSASLGLPEVVGVELTGALGPGVLSTDLALRVTQALRDLGVTGCFVEFHGTGLSSLTADDRATVANMAPEYGATTGYFPVDQRTVDYLVRTGRPEALTDAVIPVFGAMGLLHDPDNRPRYSRGISIDLSAITPSLAGPRRPQDLLVPADAAAAVEKAIGRSLDPAPDANGLPDGCIGIAAITSCTNTSDPRLLMAAGLLARKARRLGLTPKPWVKTSLAPGSPSAQDYLQRSGLLDDLEAIGFGIVGYGCTSCIGNSGTLPADVLTALDNGRAVTAVISGNRNFPGRIHSMLDLGFLASPPMVIAYALLGSVTADILSDQIGTATDGTPVMLEDIWPSQEEIDQVMQDGYRSADVIKAFSRASASAAWRDLEAADTERFPWDPASRYLRRPKFASLEETSRLGSYEAHPLMILGDDMTTDHVSPAGGINDQSEAGRWLIERGATPGDLNVFAAYRGNWEVMLRGLFTNKLAVNHLADDLAPGYTVLPGVEGSLPLWRAAEVYRQKGQSTVILAGDLYGMGSSRDWAAKGVALLGIRAVIARSFERIHRTNLIGMGILPIRITGDFVPRDAGLSANDRIIIDMPADHLAVGREFTVEIISPDGSRRKVPVRADVETLQEVRTLKAGGILPSILKANLPDHGRAVPAA